MSHPARYPFSAVVGQDRLKLALILTAVAPGIGGVLIRGEKGTAKSTIVRGLGPLLDAGAGSEASGPNLRGAGSEASGPNLRGAGSEASGPNPPSASVVELPIGATEDRVIGSLDLTRVLRDGQAHFTPGLLAQADGGVLYIDEVNLLSDHLVDVLLDAAASGRVTVERDGVSHTQSAAFVLVGTMNPEEGELRPQLLDRFGLVVDVAGPRDVDERVAIVTSRMAFDADPENFATSFAEEETDLARRIAAARAAIDDVAVPITELRRISAVCAALEVDGLRGDIVVARTAAAHAAWRGGTEVTEADVKVAVELALPHRRRRNPFDSPGMDRDELDEALERGEQAAQEPPPLIRRRTPSPATTPLPIRSRRRRPIRMPNPRRLQVSKTGRPGRRSVLHPRVPVRGCARSGPPDSATVTTGDAPRPAVVVEAPPAQSISSEKHRFICSRRCSPQPGVRRARGCPRSVPTTSRARSGSAPSPIWWCSSSICLGR